MGQISDQGNYPLDSTIAGTEYLIGTDTDLSTKTFSINQIKDYSNSFINESKFLGVYTSLGALQTAYPSPDAGSYGHVDAGIGTDVVVYVWDDTDNAYIQSTQGAVETDPIFAASPAGTITNTNISNWNSAFGWGDHAVAGYLTSDNSLSEADQTIGTTFRDVIIDGTSGTRHLRFLVTGSNGFFSIQKDGTEEFRVGGAAPIGFPNTVPYISGTPTTGEHATNKTYVDNQVGTKQDTLVSGTNIKTINGSSILGSGDLAVSGGSGDVTKVGTPVNNQIGVWTGDGTIEGDSGLTYTGSALNVTGNLNVSLGVDAPAFTGADYIAFNPTDTTPPAVKGRLYFDDSESTLKQYNGSTWEALNGGGGGSGDVTKVGTPVDNQLGVWTGDGTIEGHVGLTYNSSNQELSVLGAVGTPAVIKNYSVYIPTDTEPTASKGTLYFDDSENTLKQYNGTVWEALNGGGGGSGDVTKIGTPVDNQVGVWTGDGTIEGDSGLTYSSGVLNVSTSIAASSIISSEILLTPTDTEPLLPLEGMFYADNSENRPKYYTGSAWQALLIEGDAIESDPSVVTNGVKINNIVAAPQSDIDSLGSPDANTLYIPNDAVSYEYVQVACSDLTTDVTTGTNKGFTTSPVTGTITNVYVDLLTPGTSTGITVDINNGGTTILSTKLTTDATENTSRTASTAAVISSASITAGDRLTFDFDVVPTGGQGVVVTIEIQKS